MLTAVAYTPKEGCVHFVLEYCCCITICKINSLLSAYTAILSKCAMLYFYILLTKKARISLRKRFPFLLNLVNCNRYCKKMICSRILYFTTAKI